ncbi:MAG: ABC transporter permease [Myxococcales bacterium]|nr:ABC transporter permease [Myxococcales bacterium]MDH5306045.1 ABC transporter permease [Myxococcales bacterium]MDH5566637.1 ABC transporter permease [Myxococcales bacterium]
MKSLTCIWAIAANTVRESIRNKILYALLFFAILMIGAGVVLGSLSYVESQRILQDVGLGAIRLFGVAIAIFVGIHLIHREVDRRTIYTILSKPISRAEFLVGKYVGLTLTIWMQMAIMIAAFAGVSLLTGAPLAWQHGAFFLLAGAELALVVAIATFFSSFTTPLLAAFFTTGTWVIGHLTRDLRDIGARSDSQAMETITTLAHRVFPDLAGLNLASEAAHLLPITREDITLPLVYATGYVTVVLIAAVFLFERRDFR